MDKQQDHNSLWTHSSAELTGKTTVPESREKQEPAEKDEM